jgi:molybdopterin molybdotransferase
MIPFNEALKIVLENSKLMATENVLLSGSLGRVLAEDIPADRDMPPFNKSAVDGYACQYPSDGEQLNILETVPAGKMPKYTIKQGYCSKIMTGAEVPPGADWVVMVENTTEDGNGEFITINKKGKKSNIARKGEDFKEGDIVLPKGVIIRPRHIAIFAAVGAVQPLVYKRPSVNIITTGNELVEPNEIPGKSNIRNSNASQLRAQFSSIGLEPNYSGIIKDDEDNIREVLKKSVEKYSISVLTGGVSMGDYDFVPEMMEKAGVEILFHKIAIKPGKPTIFGKKDNHLVIGLPGNPVSTFLQFELLIKPMVYKMMGVKYQPMLVKLPLGERIQSKIDERDSWKPVEIRENKIYPINFHGSGHIHALHKADGFICIPAKEETIEKDTLIDVRQI